MSTYSTYINGTYGSPQTTHKLGKAMYILAQQVNFAKQNLDAGDGDVLRVLQVPAETLILKAWIRMITAGTTNATVDLGYGTDVNYWGNGLVLDSARVVPAMLVGTVARGSAGIDDGNSDTKSATIADATFGDICTVNLPADGLDCTTFANVQSADTVEVYIHNSAGTSRDPVGTYEIFVDKAPRAKVPLLMSSADTIDLKATTDIANADISAGIAEVKALCIDLRLA